MISISECERYVVEGTSVYFIVPISSSKDFSLTSLTFQLCLPLAAFFHPFTRPPKLADEMGMSAMESGLVYSVQ